jgi:hypothetical protein
MNAIASSIERSAFSFVALLSRFLLLLPALASVEPRRLRAALRGGSQRCYRPVAARKRRRQYRQGTKLVTPRRWRWMRRRHDLRSLDAHTNPS